MKLNCVYRYSPSLEIFRSYFDLDTGLIDGVPKEMFCRDDDGIKKKYEQCLGNYTIHTQLGHDVLERVLAYSKDALVAVDYACFDVMLHRDNCFQIVDANRLVANPEWLLAKSKIFDIGPVAPIGWAIRPVNQVSVSPNIPLLYIDKNRNIVGYPDLKLNFDISVLGILDYNNYKGYETAVLEGAFGVVYDKDKNPLILKEANNTLYIKQM